MTVCLTLAMLAGAVYCASPAEPPPGASCGKKGGAAYCHLADLTSLPAFVSYYVPADGGINCDTDCSVVADMTPVLYCEQCAACPAQLYDRWVQLDGVGRFHCRDTGGAIVPTYGRRYTGAGFWIGWYIVFDVLAADGQPPPLAWHLVAWSFVDPID